MRKRFKMSRIASSDNYELSRKISRGEHRSDYRDFIYISN